MNYIEISDKVLELIMIYTGGSRPNMDNDLMGTPHFLSAHEMAALFIDIGAEFSIDLNEMVPRLSVYSPKAIISIISDT